MAYHARVIRRRLRRRRALRALRWQIRRLSRRRGARAAAAVAAGGLVLAVAAHHGHASAPPRAARDVAVRPPSPSASSPVAVPAGLTGNAALGEQLAAGRGWGAGPQWQCLDELWTRESGWSNVARNPQSGAYGIAQALGHGPTDQYPAGPANPPQSDPAAQIRWGLAYIAGRYGTPCGAWAHELADGWY